MKLGLDGPGEIGLAKLLENDVVATSIELLGVEQESVHVKETGADPRKSVDGQQLPAHET